MAASDIRTARARLGWTQAELAERTGFSQPYVSRIEHGHAEPPRALLAALGLGGTPPEAVARELKGLPPLWRPAPRDPAAHVVVRRYLRPEASGDAFLIVELPRGAYLVAGFDTAGHGAGQVPKIAYLQGWLEGRRSGLGSAPRLESVVEDLTAELAAVGLSVGWYLGLFAPRAPAPHRFTYQGVARGFPAPQLLLSAPPAARPAAGRDGEIVRCDLRPPWRLCVASDGLLRRLGNGDEARGRQALVAWQTEESRDRDPAEQLATRAPPADDELYADVTWERWDGAVKLHSRDEAAWRRARRVLTQALRLDATRRRAVLAAVTEAVANVRRHAYGRSDGWLGLSWRDEGSRVRVEIRDHGQGVPPFSEGGGFERMRADVDAVDVRRLFPKGTAVSMSMEKGGAGRRG